MADWARHRAEQWAELIVDNAETAAQLKVSDPELRASFIRNIAAELLAERALAAEAVRAERERCAMIAESHDAAGERRKKHGKTWRFASDEAREEILAEERGESIAGAIIARRIRAAALEADHDHSHTRTET